MKKVIVLLSIVLTSMGAFSQGFSLGKSYVSVGYGLEFLNGIKSTGSTDNFKVEYNENKFGPVYLKYEYGITDNIGIGADIGYGSNSISTTSIYTNPFDNSEIKSETKANVTAYLVLAKGYYHFLLDNEKMDPYVSAGLGLGIFSADANMGSVNPNSSQSANLSLNYNGTVAVYSLTGGMRYFFTDNIGAFLELGLGAGSTYAGASVGIASQVGLVFSFGGY